MVQVVLKNISKSFGKNEIFNNISIDSGTSGKLIAIKGKSGVGKSTLLNIIAGLEKVTTGDYFLGNLNMTKKSINELAKIRGEKIGYVSQFSPVIPKLTVLENIKIPLLIWNVKGDLLNKKLQVIDQLSNQFEINHLLNKRIETLSGGEIQRVAIIRALTNKQKVIVADEPTGSLDEETSNKIIQYLHQLKLDGILIFIATHSSSVSTQCDKIYNLTKHGLIKDK